MELGPELHLSDEEDNRIYVLDLNGHIVGFDDPTLTEGYRHLPIKEECRLSLSLLSKVCLLYGLAETLLIIPGENSSGDAALMRHLEALLPPDQPDREQLAFSFQAAWNQLSRLPFALGYVNFGKPMFGSASGLYQRLSRFGCFELFVSHTLSGLLGACVSINAPVSSLSKMIQLLHSNMHLKSYFPNYFIGSTILVEYLKKASDELPEIPKLQQMHTELLQELTQKKGSWWFQNRDYIKMQLSALLDECSSEEEEHDSRFEGLENKWLKPLITMIVSRGAEGSTSFEGIHEQLRDPVQGNYLACISMRDEEKPAVYLIQEAIIETLLQDLNERKLHLYSKILKANKYLLCQSIHDHIEVFEEILDRITTPVYQCMAIARHSHNSFLREKATLCIEERQSRPLLFSFGRMQLNAYQGVARRALDFDERCSEPIGLLSIINPVLPYYTRVRSTLSGDPGSTFLYRNATLSEALRIIDEEKVKAANHSGCTIL